MGMVSWMFADKDNEAALCVGQSGYIACPDGTFISETCYDGYGIFDGKDVYELVADWNREYLNEEMLMPCLRAQYPEGKEGDRWYESAVETREMIARKLEFWKSGLLTEEQMNVKYGAGWKRDIGIDVACYDEQNASLPFPIKIVSTTECKYEELPASKGDPNQEWGESDEDE